MATMIPVLMMVILFIIMMWLMLVVVMMMMPGRGAAARTNFLEELTAAMAGYDGIDSQSARVTLGSTDADIHRFKTTQARANG
eukprot:8227899-Pyramimonas_sp.AAC.1